MMISRNERPSRASINDFGCCKPIDVARPPFSLITTSSANAVAASASVSSSSTGTSGAGSSSALGSSVATPSRTLLRAEAKLRIASSELPAERIFSAAAATVSVGSRRHRIDHLSPSSSSASQAVALPSLGARQSPRGDSEPPEPTFGAFGIAERLNWLVWKKRSRNTASHCLISSR